jgi:hypothetical protein
MKVLSLWQPYAALAVYGFKKHETRPKPAPSTIKFGERFAIASTKQVKSEQEVAAENPRLQRYYRKLNLPDWRSLPRGCIIGTVRLDGCVQITNDLIMELDEQEYVFGDWRPGRYAWLLSEPRLLDCSIPARGQQGVWDYHGDLS